MGITLLAQFQERTAQPTLVRVEEIPEGDRDGGEGAKVDETAEKVVATTLEIAYTEEGFNPNSAIVNEGDYIEWTNSTAAPIQLAQITKLYDEWEEPVIIAPDGKYKMELTQTRYWSYQEVETEAFGSVYVQER